MRHRSAAPGTKTTGGPGLLPARPIMRSGSAYWQTGSPSLVAVPPTEIAQVFAVDECAEVADQPVAVTAPIVTVTPLDDL
jgi:hypothetical protein